MFAVASDCVHELVAASVQIRDKRRGWPRRTDGRIPAHHRHGAPVTSHPTAHSRRPGDVPSTSIIVI